MPRWSAAARAAQAAAIARWKPWEKSTGPRTVRGKAVSACNAVKHGFYSAPARRLRAILTLHRHFLRRTESWLRANKLFTAQTDQRGLSPARGRRNPPDLRPKSCYTAPLTGFT